MNNLKALSLFSNVGIAESYLKQIGIDVVLANEIDKQRVKFYKHLYPQVDVLQGDITCNAISSQIINKSKEYNIDLIIATPPCQGMSTVGKKDINDERNNLIKYATNIIKEIKPKFVFFENVPEQLKTYIEDNGQKILIPDYLKKELGINYIFNDDKIINACDYGIAQLRQRSIILLVRKDLNRKWNYPPKEKKLVTLEDAIGNLPSLDPEIYDIEYSKLIEIFPDFEKKKKSGLNISKWHYPPKHVFRQVFSLMHTPTGKTAFDNIDKFKPRKQDGSLIKGFKNTYKRQEWEKPAFTITMYNRTIGSQNNVHPGRLIGKDNEGYELYSDARVLTIYELMLVSSLPKDWNIPNWASDNFIRQVIGEGIPPLLVKKIMMELINE